MFPTRVPHRPTTLRRRRRGFTLLEVIVVVTIIALLAALVAPKVWKHIGGAKEKIAEAEVNSLAQQVRLWMVDNGLSRVPDDFELALLADGDDRYVEPDELLDPWNNPYSIVIPGEFNSDFDIVSYGADGERGGEGEDGDVHN